MENTSYELGYGETTNLQVVKIPYKESGFYMLIAIPKKSEENIGEPIPRLIGDESVITRG